METFPLFEYLVWGLVALILDASGRQRGYEPEYGPTLELKSMYV
jgi:hypothetical protein